MTKDCSIYTKYHNQNTSLKYLCGVSFQVTGANCVPLYWLKIDKVCQLMNNLNDENKASFFKTISSEYIRTQNGGESERKVNAKGYPYYQLFCLVELEDQDNVNDFVSDMILHVSQFLTCVHFKKVCLQMLQGVGTRALYNLVNEHDNDHFGRMEDLKDQIVSGCSLNTLLCDEEIRTILENIFENSHIKFKNMTDKQKDFCFEGGNPGSFNFGMK